VLVTPKFPVLFIPSFWGLYTRRTDETSGEHGLGKIRFQDLRHGFGSLLIQGGTSLAYVKEQIGHSSMQVTVDEYGHLIPGANVNWVDRLDREPRLH